MSDRTYRKRIKTLTLLFELSYSRDTGGARRGPKAYWIDIPGLYHVLGRVDPLHDQHYAGDLADLYAKLCCYAWDISAMWAGVSSEVSDAVFRAANNAALYTFLVSGRLDPVDVWQFADMVFDGDRRVGGGMA